MQQESTSLCDTKYKIVFLGDMGVGKTSIIQRFVKDQFDAFNNPTVGIDFLTRNISFQNKIYRIQLWDTAGQEKYKSLVPAYLRDANCAVFVFQFGRPQTFDNLYNWIQLYRDHESEESVAFILGNKYDLIDNSNSSPSKNNKTFVKDLQINALQLARRQNMIFKSVSAKTGKQINMSFQKIIEQIQRKNKKQQISQYLDQQQKLQKQFLNKFQKLRLNTSDSSKFNCCYI